MNTFYTILDTYRSTNTRRGFTLLLAALVAAVVLALGSSIYSIAQKQITLSSIGRDSQFAFYAADSAIECVLYHDVQLSAFPTSDTPGTVLPVTCDQVSMSTVVTAADSDTAITVIGPETIFTDTGEGNCVQVTITKDEAAEYPTLIHADGYSTPCDVLTNSARTLQRSVELRY